MEEPVFKRRHQELLILSGRIPKGSDDHDRKLQSFGLVNRRNCHDIVVNRVFASKLHNETVLGVYCLVHIV